MNLDSAGFFVFHHSGKVQTTAILMDIEKQKILSNFQKFHR